MTGAAEGAAGVMSSGRLPSRTGRVLMLAYSIPPCTTFPSAAARAHGLASWLAEFGWAPTVLAPVIGSVCSCEACQSGEEIAARPYELRRVAVSPHVAEAPDSDPQSREIHHAVGARFQRKAVSAWRVASAAVSHLDPISNWPVAAVAAANELIQQRPVDAVWATAWPYSSLWAADRIAGRFSLPWVADIRDALAVKWNLANYKNMPALARSRQIVRRATAVVEANAAQAPLDAEWFGRACQTIISGFDPADWTQVIPALRPRQWIDVVFAGKIYPGYRTITPALLGLQRLFQMRPQAPVRLRYFGRSDAAVRAASRSLGVNQAVDCCGFVSPHDLRVQLASADILLLPTSHPRPRTTLRDRVLARVGNELEFAVPGGKLYEYLGARRPILAVPGNDQFVNRLLNETGVGFAASTPEEIAGIFDSWLHEWTASGHIAYRGVEHAVAKYSIRESAAQLASLLDAVVR